MTFSLFSKAGALALAVMTFASTAGGANDAVGAAAGADKNADPGAVVRAETLASLAAQFEAPAAVYRPHVWWHWTGANFSKAGITKDLEAMKEVGIGGATIFNVGTFMEDVKRFKPLKGTTPWPDRTYRSEAYWEHFGFALDEAERLDLKIGFHNSPGWSETGGPWITEAMSMQTVVTSKTKVVVRESGQWSVVSGQNNATGGAGSNAAAGTGAAAPLRLKLPAPPLPARKGRRATFFKDIAVFAVPDRADATAGEVIALTGTGVTGTAAQVTFNPATGELLWRAPAAGAWQIVRVAHASTAARSMPEPHELFHRGFEADKLSRTVTEFHWRNVLEPVQRRFARHIGTTLTNVWIDSYEAGAQNWTPGFEREFAARKGYDPLPWLALKAALGDLLRNRRGKPDFTSRADIVRFDADHAAVVNRLILDNSWRAAKRCVNAAGLLLYQEPYEGPFDPTEGTAIPDVPVTEFWTHADDAKNVSYLRQMRAGILRSGKRLIAAEAFTGWPDRSAYTESPAFLKHYADLGFAGGANFLFLHNWSHQPFDDAFQPAMSLGPFGTHFGRHQTWHHESRAFFTYLARCQMLLQQGTLVSLDDDLAAGGLRHVHRRTPEAEIHFLANLGKTALPVELTAFTGTGAKTKTAETGTGAKFETAEIWDAEHGTISRADTSNQLTLLPDKSAFLIIPRAATPYAKLPPPTTAGKSSCSGAVHSATTATGAAGTTATIAAPWRVRFVPKLGTPFEREFPALTDFATSADPAVRYFAGTAVYSTSFTLPPRSPLILDLGTVHHLARVTVNGRDAGVLWHPPYRADITRLVHAGTNTLEIAVTNNWCNALIGDEQFPEDFPVKGRNHREMPRFPQWFLDGTPRPEPRRKTFTPFFYYTKNSPLQPSGLLGPVKIISR
ncbi:MAG: hypothetical protein LBR07_00750 [Puniceicoccales bacterium]|jgi:hypothetical protein|nr:hypothetical protein [Puniceicoccales bacterium]